MIFKRKKSVIITVTLLMLGTLIPLTLLANEQGGVVGTSAENLSSRALVAIDAAGADTLVTDTSGRVHEQGVYLSWRIFEEDPADITFTLYRNGAEISSGLTVSNLIDEGGKAGDAYRVVASSDRQLGIESEEIIAWDEQFLELSLFKPENQIMPDGSETFFTANDMSVGDVTGNGELDLIVKWAPSNQKDNAHSGFTGTTILDAYEIDTSTGAVSLLWRIDLGVNIRSGAHYTQFQVWDFNGDGHGDIALKTADGSTIYKSLDGTDETLVETGYVGAVPASQLPTHNRESNYDFRNDAGYILAGPEYFTIFNGKTGEIMDTTDYLPPRGDDIMADWGDGYGNRVDRFLSAVAFLDGENPYAVFARGYYTRTALTAYYVDEFDKIQVEWAFDSKTYDFSDSHLTKGEVEGSGFHSLSVNDVDGDGTDEIIYGSVVFNSDGTPRYATGLGHGDAMHVSDWVPWNEGLEVMTVHESVGAPLHVAISDAATGEILMGYFVGADVGRGKAADIDPTSEGAEFWASAGPRGDGENEWYSRDGGVFATTSTLDNLVQLAPKSPAANFSIFWDGDLLSEVFDHEFDARNWLPIATTVSKWDYVEGDIDYIFYTEDAYTSNGTKGNAGLVADLLGDWREEFIIRDANEDHKIRIYTTGYETDYVIPTLLQNHAYRVGIAWQNVAYNQPANLDYLLSEGLITAQLQLEAHTHKDIRFNFTEASDGVYGHVVVGYEIYRAEGNGDYELLEVLKEVDFEDSETFTYLDSNVEPNTRYAYQVAAIVNERTGHLSMPLVVETGFEVLEVLPFTLEPVVQDTPLKNEETVADLLPQTLKVLDVHGVERDAGVSWDVTGVDLATVGAYPVEAIVVGYPTAITASLTIIENIPVGQEPVTITSLIGEEPTLPELVTVLFKNGTSKELPVQWDTSQLDIYALGETIIQGSLFEYDYAVEAIIRVVADYIVEIDDFNRIHYLEVALGTSLADANLPTTIEATYYSGAIKTVPVTWETSRWDTSVVSRQEIMGTSPDYDGTLTLHLHVDHAPLWQFDFGVDPNLVEPGWTGVTVNQRQGVRTWNELGIAYDQEKGYGFIVADLDARAIEGRTELYTFNGLLPRNVYGDFALISETEFAVDVPDGTYVVEIVATTTAATNNRVRYSIEGSDPVTISNAINTYAMGREEVEVKDGQMNIEFLDPGVPSRMGAIIIRPVLQDPEIVNPELEGARQELESYLEAINLEELDSAEYSEAIWEAFIEAYEVAQIVLADSEEIVELKATLADLEAAYKALLAEKIPEEDPDLEAVRQKLESYLAAINLEELDSAEYPEALWEAFIETYETAQRVLAVSEEIAELKAVLADLEAAYEALLAEKIPEEDPDLEAVRQELESYLAAIKLEELDSADYPESLWEAFIETYETAQRVLAVSEEIAELKAVLADLEEAYVALLAEKLPEADPDLEAARQELTDYLATLEREELDSADYPEALWETFIQAYKEAQRVLVDSEETSELKMALANLKAAYEAMLAGKITEPLVEVDPDLEAARQELATYLATLKLDELDPAKYPEALWEAFIHAYEVAQRVLAGSEDVDQLKAALSDLKAAYEAMLAGKITEECEEPQCEQDQPQPSKPDRPQKPKPDQNHSQDQLPQTGAKTSSAALGLLFVLMSGLVTKSYKKKHL